MDVYLPYDMNVNGVDTTHFIKAVRSGIARDVSISFEPDRIVCSLDGRSMPRSIFDLLMSDEDDPNAPCRHIPGMSYVVDGKKVRALGKIHGAHCMELSPVFRGATPGAAIVSPSRALVIDEHSGPPSWAMQSPSLRVAGLLAEADLLDPRAALQFEEHVRGVSFPSITTRSVAGWRHDQEEDMNRAMPKKATDDDPDPDGDGDDDRTPEGDTDHSHFTPDGKPKYKRDADDETIPEEEPMTSRAADEESAVIETPASAGEAAGTLTAPPPASAAPPPATRAAVAPVMDPPAAIVPIWHTDLRAALFASELVPDGFDGDPVEKLREIGNELKLERAWGGWGRRYRQELCADIESEGVRAFGADVWDTARAAYLPNIQRGSADELLDLRKHFRDLAAKRLQGGRLTEELDPKANQTEHVAPANPRRVPSYAYRS